MNKQKLTKLKRKKSVKKSIKEQRKMQRGKQLKNLRDDHNVRNPKTSLQVKIQRIKRLHPLHKKDQRDQNLIATKLRSKHHHLCRCHAHVV